MGVAGGGPGSFIGPVHRAAARLDGCYELIAGVVSSDPDRARAAGESLGFAPDRRYGDVQEMLQAEAAREDGIDVLAIMTPNDTHVPYGLLALERGLDVICDKPMARTVEEASELHRGVDASGLVFCLTHVYAGYPLVRQAREMVAAGDLGTVRLVEATYVQGGNAREDSDPTSPRSVWRKDPDRAGRSLVLGDIGSHAHHLIRFVTGLEVAEICADVGTAVPNRTFDDAAGALLRMSNGARGILWATQAAAGVENSLRLRVSGTGGTLEWDQETPMHLDFKPLDGARQMRTPNGPAATPLAKHSSRIVAGHPGGFIEAFANLYRDAAEAIAVRRAGGDPSDILEHLPDATDGLRGMEFIEAALRSSDAHGAWVRCTA